MTLVDYPGDGNAGNDSTLATLNVAAPDLGLTSSLAPSTVAQNGSYTWTVSVKNNGTSAIANYAFNGSEIVAPSSAPAGGSCKQATAIVRSPWYCEGGPIAAGQTQTYVFNKTAPATAGDKVHGVKLLTLTRTAGIVTAFAATATGTRRTTSPPRRCMSWRPRPRHRRCPPVAP